MTSPLSSKTLLTHTEHRAQWPLPRQPWVMAQSWARLLFAHWPLPPAVIAPHLPAGLTLDTYEGQAWLSVVPFGMCDVRLRGVVTVPGLRAFPELNVRTYVRVGGLPGVWFFSLDADHLPAVAAARRLFHLPYYKAQMRIQQRDETVLYTSSRNHPGGGSADFRGAYRPVGPVYHSEPGTLEYWLTERYYLYTADKSGQLYRAAVHHLPWPLQPTVARITENTMLNTTGIALEGPPALLHYADRLDVLTWYIERI